MPTPASSGAIRTSAPPATAPEPFRSMSPPPAGFGAGAGGSGGQTGSGTGDGSIARRSAASRSGRSAETTRSAPAPRLAASRAASSSARLSSTGRGSSSPVAPRSRARARAFGSGLTTRTGGPAANAASRVRRNIRRTRAARSTGSRTGARRRFPSVSERTGITIQVGLSTTRLAAGQAGSFVRRRAGRARPGSGTRAAILSFAEEPCEFEDALGEPGPVFAGAHDGLLDPHPDPGFRRLDRAGERAVRLVEDEAVEEVAVAVRRRKPRMAPPPARP